MSDTKVMQTEKTQEEKNKIYIKMSKTNINNCISDNNYKNAFTLLILVLERLDNNEKIEFIDYYSKNLYEFTRVFDPIEDISLFKKRFSSTESSLTDERREKTENAKLGLIHMEL
jgi:hypothetical protein